MLEHQLALLVLNMLPGIGPLRKRILIESFGSIEAALAAPADVLAGIPGIGSRLSEILCHWERYCRPEEELSLVRRAGATVITEEDDVYPPLLREIHDPPICLYVLGDLSCLAKTNKAIAVVGSRHTTNYGLRMAASLSNAACHADWTVVSGLARGIDTSAHEAALQSGGLTIAVVGSGLACIYPAENRPLARRIIDQGGAVVSEFPMMYRPDKRSFPMRNRIISGMSQGTLVVQAGLQSGSLITAAQATEQGRAVFAVPGLVDIPQSRGCHALLRDGARLVESFDDILDEFSQFPELRRSRAHSSQNNEKTGKTPAVELQMSGLELKLYSFLEDESEMYIDDLIDACDEGAPAVMACLLAMEMRRLVKQLPGKRVIRADKIGPASIK